MPRPLLLTALLFGAQTLLAQADAAPAASTASTGFLADRIDFAGSDHRFVLFVPPGYRSDRRWPLIVFLNGAGECGTDGWKQVSVGLGPAIMHDVDAWPFLVLFPQKPDVRSAWEDHDELVMAMLAKVRRERAVDDKQLFLTGLSQGGHGTWVLGARHHDLWAAIAPVCGYGSPAEIGKPLRAMPIWCFHGEDDKSVPVRQSKDLVAAVNDAGGFAELSLYPRTGHNAWDHAYRDEPLAAWLLAAARDRTEAAYTAGPELLTSASIEVQNEWDSDGGPAFRGTITATLTLERDGLSWRVATAYAPGTIVPDPEPQKGRLEAREGRKLLLARLRALQAGGVFELPERIQPAPPKGTVMASNHYTVDVALDGKPGPWRFHRDVTRLAEFDPRFRDQTLCIDAFLQAMKALH
jgi:dienelactone hydrolase